MKLRTLIGELESIFHPDSAESWDNVGLIVGNDQRDVNKIVVSLDFTKEVIDYAVENECELIITHHPAIFDGLKNITSYNLHGKKILKVIENKIAVYSIHTNADMALHGLNDYIMNKLEFKGNMTIKDYTEYETYNVVKDKIETHKKGYTRLFTLKNKMKLKTLSKHIKEKLGIEYVRYVGRDDKEIKTIGLITGGGASFIGNAKDEIDVFLTGDLRYHEALDSFEEDFALVDIGHYESEYLFCDMMKEILEHIFDGEVAMSYGEPVFKFI